jgi:hypothetical protein
MAHGVEGRTKLSDADRELLGQIRKAEALRWLAYAKRDALIVEAYNRGIKRAIIAGAAGLAPNESGCAQIHKILSRPYKIGMPKPGRRRKARDGAK